MLNVVPRRCTCPWFVSTVVSPGGDGSRFHTARGCCVSDFWLSMAKRHGLQSWKPFWSHGPLALTVAVGYVSSTKAQQFLEDTRTSLLLSEPVSQAAGCCTAKGQNKQGSGCFQRPQHESVTNTWEKKAGKVLMFPVTKGEGCWGLSPPTVTAQQWDICTPSLFCGLYFLSPWLVEGMCEGMLLCVSCEMNGPGVVTDPQRAGWRQPWGWQGSLLGWCSSSLACGPQCLPHIPQCW